MGTEGNSEVDWLSVPETIRFGTKHRRLPLQSVDLNPDGKYRKNQNHLNQRCERTNKIYKITVQIR